MLLTDILAKGYLPKELPPPFNSRDFALFGSIVLPAAWQLDKRGEFSKSCELEKYNHRRVGVLRRRLAFPNPVLFYHLAAAVAAAWPTLRRHHSSGSWSATRPIRTGRRNRAFAASRTGPQRTTRLAQVRQSSRYILQADIARFYPSIYTHSIPWALYGRSVAKTNTKASANLGNQLDYWMRMGQSRQTVGIPIGPDTSWIVSELLLSAVEVAFKSRFGASPPGSIMIDDFEIGCKSLPEAEQALADLEAVLNEFELSLNPKKTEIHPLPRVIGNTWTDDLATFEFRPSPKGQGTDLIRFFNLAFEYTRSFPDDAVLKYAVSRLWALDVAKDNWKLFQSLLLQCMTVEPSTLPFVEREFRRQRSRGHLIDLKALSESVDVIIRAGAPLGHTSEVAWAVWVALVFGAKIENDAAKLLCRMEDSFVALTALHAESIGVFNAPLDHSTWEKHQIGGALWGSNWLLSYEANRKGWLPSTGRGDHVSADAHFAELKARGISFYDERLAPSRTGQGLVRIGSSGYPNEW